MGGRIEDERAFKRALREATGEAGREEIQAAVEDAVRFANDALRRLGDNPPPDATLDEWSVEAIADSVELRWEGGKSEGALEKGDVLIAEWTHPHTDKIEVGVKPHMIEGDDYLVFEWHNIPDDVAAQFEDSWNNPDSFLEEPMVAFTEIEHPGIPGTGFIKQGFQRSLRKHFS